MAFRLDGVTDAPILVFKRDAYENVNSNVETDTRIEKLIETESE